jgi:hypothetical protein
VPKLGRADGGALQLLHVRREFAAIGSHPTIRGKPKPARSIVPRLRFIESAVLRARRYPYVFST